MFEEDHKEFLSDRVFDRIGIMVLDSQEREGVVDLLNDLFREVDLSGVRGESLLNVYDYMVGKGCEQKVVSLVLALLDGGYSIVDIVEKSRTQALSTLGRDRSDLEDDPDQIDLVDREISDLQEALFSQLFGKLGIDEFHETTPFEGAYVRQRAIDGKKMWLFLKGRLAQALGLSEQAIASAKAWKKPSLKEKGGGTVESLIEGLREKFEEVLEVDELVEDDVVEVPTFDRLYQFIEDDSDCDFVESLKPKSFDLVNGKIVSDLRQWIFGVVLLTSEERRKDVRKLIAQFLGCKVGKVASVTAYLIGGCRDRASDEILGQIEVVEDYIGRKGGGEANGVWEGDPDYGNESKERGDREPKRRMIEKVWGKEAPLKGKTMLIMETPRLLEWEMLKGLGGEEENLTIVERDPKKVKELKRLLPKSNIIGMSLQEWLTGIFRDRTQGMTDDLQKRGLPTDGSPLRFDQVLKASYPVKISIAQGCLDWMWNDPRFANYGEEFNRYLADPYFIIREAIDVSRDVDCSFDFVSLDTTSKFANFSRLVEVILNLEILGDEGVLCTNCAGQREVDSDKESLANSIRTQQAMDFRGRDWLQFIKGSVSDLKVGVSLDLLKMVSFGANQYGNRSFCKTDSPFFKAILSSGLVADSGLMRVTVEEVISGFADIDDDGIAQAPEKHFLTALKMSMGRPLVERAFRLMARKLFKPAFNRMGAKHMRTVKELGCIDCCDSKSALFGLDAVSDFLADIFVDRLGRKRVVLEHEAFVYRGGKTNMLSDFFHAPRSSSYLGLSDSIYQKMMKSILTGRPLTGVKARILLKAVLRNSEYGRKYLAYRNNVNRVKV